MPRPKKPRRCGCKWRGQIFGPAGRGACRRQALVITSGELEALRLCDLEGLTQDEAGVRMGVSRGSVQRAVKSGRSKIVAALIQGGRLVVHPPEGGMKKEEEQ